MKKIMFALMIMLLPIMVMAEDFIVTNAQYIVITGNTLDTLGRTMITPDSIRIVVTDSSGTELFDAWFESADAQCALNGDVITFFDQWGDINGAASLGTFSIMATIASDANGNIDVTSNQNYTVRGVATTTEAMYANIVSILAEVVNLDAWNPITDNDSLIIDQSTIEDMTVATVTNVTTVLGIANDVITDAVIATNAIGALEIAPDAIGISEIAAGAIDADALATSAIDEIADAIWNELMSGHTTALSFGDSLIKLITLTRGNVDELERAEIHVTGAVTGGAPGVTGIGSTTQLAGFVDDYWNNQVVVFVTGNAAGQSTRITDFTDATDSITFDAITTAPAAGDSFIIVAQYDAGGGSATISAADMAFIADTIFHRDSADVNDGAATSFGTLLMKPAYVQGAASGLDTTAIKKMMAGNPEIVSGYQIAWRGSVNDGSPSNDRFVVDGIDLNKATNFYDNMDLIWFTGALKGESQPIYLWKTTNDSIIIRPFSAAPADNDSFVLVADFFTVVDSLVDNSITAGAIAANAIGASEIANNAIGNTQVANDFLTASKIADGAIGSDQIATNAIGTAEIATGAIGVLEFSAGLISRILDSLLLRAVADTTTGSIFAKILRDASANRDTLELQDNWVATSANQTLIIDSLQVTLDSVRAALDSLQLTAITNLKEAFDDDGVGPVMQLSQLRVEAGPTEDTAVIFRSTGLAQGLFIWSDSADGMLSQGSALAGLGNGVRYLGGAGGGHGVRATGGPGGDGMQLNAGTGSGNALGLTVNAGDLIQKGFIDSSALNLNFLYEFWAYNDSTAPDLENQLTKWLVNNLAGGGGSGLDTLNTAFVGRFLSLIADSNWLSLLEARDGVVGSFGDSAQGWSTQADFTQIPGADVSLTYLALDTSTNTGIQGVSVSGYNMSDVRVAFGTTDGNGEITFGFKLNDTVYFNSNDPINYVWVQRDTALLIQNGDLDTTEGYQFSGDAPAASSVAAVTIFVKDNAGVAIKNIRVTAQFVRGNLIDSTGIPVSNAIQRGKTDSDGKYTFNCIWSSTVIPDTDWRFTVHTLGGVVSRTITVGRQTGITLDFR